MSACTCCPETTRELEAPRGPVLRRNASLFNWVTVLLVSGWVAIVTFALHHAATSKTSLPTVETFISSMI